jgi:hypothetical protein
VKPSRATKLTVSEVFRVNFGSSGTWRASRRKPDVSTRAVTLKLASCWTYIWDLKSKTEKAVLLNQHLTCLWVLVPIKDYKSPINAEKPVQLQAPKNRF